MVNGHHRIAPEKIKAYLKVWTDSKKRRNEIQCSWESIQKRGLPDSFGKTHIDDRMLINRDKEVIHFNATILQT